MRDAIISALALMDETDAISCLLEATREREANHRAEMRRRLIQAEEERDTAEGAGVIISIICDVFEVDESDLRGSARGSRIWEARSTAYVLMMDLLDMLPREVASALGRERSTVVKVSARARLSESRRSRLSRSLCVDALA